VRFAGNALVRGWEVWYRGWGIRFVYGMGSGGSSGVRCFLGGNLRGFRVLGLDVSYVLRGRQRLSSWGHPVEKNTPQLSWYVDCGLSGRLGRLFCGLYGPIMTWRKKSTSMWAPPNLGGGGFPFPSGGPGFQKNKIWSHPWAMAAYRQQPVAAGVESLLAPLSRSSRCAGRDRCSGGTAITPVGFFLDAGLSCMMY